MDLSQVKLPKWAIVGIAALVLFGIGSAIYNSGWSQGFLMGLLTGNTDGGALTPYLTARTHGWHGHGGGGFFGAFFRLIFFVFLIGLIFKFLGFWRWRRHGWHGGPGWYGGPEGYRGPGGWGERVEGHYGPWSQQPYAQQPYAQPPSQGQPSQPSASSGPQAQPGTPPSGTADSAAGGEQGDEHRPQPTSWTQV